MRRGTGPITQWLIGINVIVFIFGNLEFALSGGSYVYGTLELNYTSVLHGAIWQPFTAMFLHAPLFQSILPFHLLFNMFALWQYGSLNERLYTRNQYLGIYLGAGLIGNIASLLVYALTPGGIGSLIVGYASLGASGAIFGLIGSFVAYARGTRAYGNALLNAILVLAVSSFAVGVVNPIAHVFGILSGYTLGRYIVKPVQSVYSVQYQTVGPPPEYPWRLSGPEGRI